MKKKIMIFILLLFFLPIALGAQQSEDIKNEVSKNNKSAIGSQFGYSFFTGEDSQDTSGSVFIGGYGGILWQKSLFTGIEVFMNINHSFEADVRASGNNWTASLGEIEGSMWMLGIVPTVKYTFPLNNPLVFPFIGLGFGAYYANGTLEGSDESQGDTNPGLNFEGGLGLKLTERLITKCGLKFHLIFGDEIGKMISPGITLGYNF